MERGRIKGLDGIRAFAALMVFAEHQLWPAQWMFLGRLGVELFFVLSGYLIVGILTARAEVVERGLSTRWEEIKSFFVRRSFRIFPAYYGLCGVMALLATLGVFDINLSLYRYYLTYTTNIAFSHIFEGWPQGQNFGHFWTLAIEEQFYLLLAPLFLCLPARMHKAACLGVVAVALAAAGILRSVGMSWFSVGMDSLVNFGYLALGGVISQTVRPGSAAKNGPILAGVGLCLGLAIICLLTRPAGGAEFSVAIAMGGASAVVIAQVVRNQRAGLIALLETRPLRWLGSISYALYLYHIFVKLPHTGIAFKGMDLIVLVNLALAIALAQASWMLIERPSLKLRDRYFSPKARVSTATTRAVLAE